MESLLTAPVQLASPHAIPFRTIFEEHLQRRQNHFMHAVATVFDPAVQAWHAEQVRNPERTDPPCPTVAPVIEGELAPPERMLALLQAVRRQENAYAALAKAIDDIENGRPDPSTKCLRTDFERELGECADADGPLKRVLQLTDASALCLSGGGIRSASFCLGVLQGLSRISESSEAGGKTKNLMEELDFLSTVSGGGYIGSWLIAWTYRRMLADRAEPAIHGRLYPFGRLRHYAARALCLRMLDTLEHSEELRRQECDAFSRNLVALAEAVTQTAKNADRAAEKVQAKNPVLSAPLQPVKAAHRADANQPTIDRS